VFRPTILLLLLASVGAVAAPVPVPGDKQVMAALWGKTAGRAEFEFARGQLTVRSTSGAPHVITAGNATARMDAPRTARTVTGDFEITLRVADATAPAKGARFDGRVPETGAGLYINGGDTVSFRYYLQQSYDRPDLYSHFRTRSWLVRFYFGSLADPALTQNLEPVLHRATTTQSCYPNGCGLGGGWKVPDGKSAYIRVVRRGQTLTTFCSFDGEKWIGPGAPNRALEKSLPDEVTVGAFLSHNTYEKPTATFDNFTIGKPKDAQPK